MDGELLEALEWVTEYAMDWYNYYCEMWGTRRVEQQELMLERIERARAFLASYHEEPKEKP